MSRRSLGFAGLSLAIVTAAALGLFLPADSSDPPSKLGTPQGRMVVFADRLERLLSRKWGIRALRTLELLADVCRCKLNEYNTASEVLWELLSDRSDLDCMQDLFDSAGNLDCDMIVDSETRLCLRELRELVDVWGNPMVYWDASLLDSLPDPQRCMMSDRHMENVCLDSSLRAEICSGTRLFVLLSAGPDGHFGTSDDIFK
jgi:hypothetical protein